MQKDALLPKSSNIVSASSLRPISLAHLTVLGMSPPKQIALAAEAGYQSVDLRLAAASPEDIEFPMFGDTPMRREVIDMVAGTGVTVFDVEIIRMGKQTTAPDYEYLFEVAARIGARRVKVVGDETDECLMAEKFSCICELAYSFHLAVDLEFMVFSGIKTLESAERVVKFASQPNGSILIDALHLARSGKTPDKLGRIDVWCPGYFQLCDAPLDSSLNNLDLIQEARTARLPPGDGALPLVDLVRAFRHDCPVSLEVPRKTTFSILENVRQVLHGAKKVLGMAG